MNDQTQVRERITPRTPTGTIDNRPALTLGAPAVFRRQERFWKEVKNRITERNPAVRELFERLY